MAEEREIPERLRDVGRLVRELPPIPELPREPRDGIPDRRRGRISPGPAGIALISRYRDWLLARHRSPRTIEAYIAWVARYLQHHRVDHPRPLGAAGVNAFLSALARAGLGTSTHNQARAALTGLLRDLLGEPVDRAGMVSPARRSARIPTVLSKAEALAVLRQMPRHLFLPTSLLYSSGLRLLECLQLRVKDVDLEYCTVTVRGGKGAKDRVTPLADELVPRLARHLARRRAAWERDLARGIDGSTLRGGVRRKFPNAGRDWPWQYVFAATRVLTDADGRRCRHHLHETVLQRAVPTAARAAGISKRVTCHTFRHSFATHLLQDGYDIRQVQALLGHRDVRTTMLYTHVVQRGGLGVRSPLDAALLEERRGWGPQR